MPDTLTAKTVAELDRSDLGRRIKVDGAEGRLRLVIHNLTGTWVELEFAGAGGERLRISPAEHLEVAFLAEPGVAFEGEAAEATEVPFVRKAHDYSTGGPVAIDGDGRGPGPLDADMDPVNAGGVFGAAGGEGINSTVKRKGRKVPAATEPLVEDEDAPVLVWTDDDPPA